MLHAGRGLLRIGERGPIGDRRWIEDGQVGKGAGPHDAAIFEPEPLGRIAAQLAIGLFKGEQVGRNVKLDPASFADMCGREVVIKPSLEVVYDTV